MLPASFGFAGLPKRVVVLVNQPLQCCRQYSIMSRSPVYMQQKMLKKKAQQASKPDPNKNKQQPQPLLNKDSKMNIPTRNEPGKSILGSVEDSFAHGFVTVRPVQPQNPHILSIALVGAPNAGKSTLVNWLVKDQVSAISSKAQTTRDRIMGIVTEGNTQMLLYDTPGIVPSRNRSRTIKDIVTTAWETIEEADVVLFIVDASRAIDENVIHIMHQLETNLSEIKRQKEEEQQKKEAEKDEKKIYNPLTGLGSDNTKQGLGGGKDCILVINKIDKVFPRDNVLPKIQKLNETGLFKETFFTNALEGERIDELKDYLMKRSTPGPWTYEPHLTTNLVPLQRVFEVIREKLFLSLNKEIPYHSHTKEYVVKQHNIGWTILPDGSLRIDQRLIVPKASQRVVILGKAGALLKRITTHASKDLERIFDRKVYLNLMVQEKKSGWGEKETF